MECLLIPRSAGVACHWRIHHRGMRLTALPRVTRFTARMDWKDGVWWRFAAGVDALESMFRVGPVKRSPRLPKVSATRRFISSIGVGCSCDSLGLGLMRLESEVSMSTTSSWGRLVDGASATGASPGALASVDMVLATILSISVATVVHTADEASEPKPGVPSRSTGSGKGDQPYPRRRMRRAWRRDNGPPEN